MLITKYVNINIVYFETEQSKEWIDLHFDIHEN